MKGVIYLVLFAVFAGGRPASFGQTYETFADRPDRRAERVREAREKASRERELARQWARIYGMPMRQDDGKRLIELVAVRNGLPVYRSTRNRNAAISSAADAVRLQSPFNAGGTNLTVGVWDGGGVMTSHQEFGGRVADMDGVASHYHATHVGGTIAAVGLDTNAMGMAPAVSIDSYDWTDDIAEMISRAASYPGEPDKIYLSNHSYGTVGGWTWAWRGTANWYWPEWLEWTADAVDIRFGQYDAGAIDYDQVVYDAPYFLPFVSAGNDRSDNPTNNETVYYLKPLGPGHVGKWTEVTYDDRHNPLGDGAYKGGYDNISAEATAKNIMTVGAVSDAVSNGVRSTASASVLYFSSWGPADDGRIKPDIVANGERLYSCDNDSTDDYLTLSGTSMSAPNACGSAALLVDYYGQRFPGSAMRASTLKGLIIHTADDLGDPGPDYASGWGLMNTWAAAELIRDYADGNSTRMAESTLSATNMSDTFVYESDGLASVRVTLCWTDPPGPVQTLHDSPVPVLVNDLDLKLVGPGGTNYPFVLNPAQPSSNATSLAENDVDNVEQVYIDSPLAGEYTIVVDYDGGLQGGEQHYSLLVSGLSTNEAPLNPDLDGDGMPDAWELMHYGDPTGAVASADSDGDGQDNLSEYISGHNPTNAMSHFSITGFEMPGTGSVPFIIRWDSVTGRVYGISWAPQMTNSFTNISGQLPYPAGSYTDTVERSDPNRFYKIDVQLLP